PRRTEGTPVCDRRRPCAARAGGRWILERRCEPEPPVFCTWRNGERHPLCRRAHRRRAARTLRSTARRQQSVNHVRRFAIVASFVGALPSLAAAAQFSVPPTPTHFVTDNANALSSSTRSSLEDELRAYQQSSGHQIIVWIGQTTGDVPLETWTGDSAHQWRI